MSHATAAATVLWGVFFGETTTIVSVGEREAQEVLDMAEKHAQILVECGSEWAQHRRKTDRITFIRSAGRIIAVPASSSGRGFSGNIFLDEYAYQEKAEQVWDAAAATTLHKGRMRVSSTPNGVGNAFHALWTNPKQNKGWVKHQVSISAATAQGMSVSLDECWSMAKGDPRVFGQMFECSFLDGDEQYIPTDLVVEAMKDAVAPDPSEGHWYAGFDVGRENDLSVLAIVQQDRHNHIWLHEVRVGQRMDFPSQVDAIVNAFQTWPIKKLCVDSTGAGSGPADYLVKILGRSKVEPYPFSLQSKEVLATDMYQTFATKLLHLPEDQALLKDIVSIRRIITTEGKVKYDAPVTAEGHADRAWALALAIQACARKPGARTIQANSDFAGTL